MVSMTATLSAPTLPAAPLTGQALLLKAKTLGHLSRRSAAIECGYGYLSEGGDVRVKTNAFDRALADAANVVSFVKCWLMLPTFSFVKSEGVGKRGASYELTLSPNLGVVVGKAYFGQLDAEPGDKVKVEVDKRQRPRDPVGFRRRVALPWGLRPPFRDANQIWQPGPWGEDLGRSMTSQELLELQAQRVRERQADLSPAGPARARASAPSSSQGRRR